MESNDRIQVGDRSQTRTLAQLLVFYLVIIFVGSTITVVLGQASAPSVREWIVDTDLFSLLFVPLCYWFDSRIFSGPYWQYSFLVWLGIIVIVPTQFLIDALNRSAAPIGRYDVVGILFVAPFVEELARAVSIRPLMEKLGPIPGILVCSLMWALLHHLFWVALLQQFILTVLFVYSRKSLPSAIAVHFMMNLVAVCQFGVAR